MHFRAGSGAPASTDELGRLQHCPIEAGFPAVPLLFGFVGDTSVFDAARQPYALRGDNARMYWTRNVDGKRRCPGSGR